MCLEVSFFFFFFFQAEDGIRDLYVTGVQTCALPILRCTAGRLRRNREPVQYCGDVAMERGTCRGEDQRAMPAQEQRDAQRSFERRHLPRQRRLREEELFRGAGERQQPSRGLEAPEEVERGEPAQRFKHASDSCNPFAKTV